MKWIKNSIYRGGGGGGGSGGLGGLAEESRSRRKILKIIQNGGFSLIFLLFGRAP